MKMQRFCGDNDINIKYDFDSRLESTKDSSVKTHKKAKSNVDASYGIPKHLEVITFITKKRSLDLTSTSQPSVPQKPLRNIDLAYSTRKKSLQTKIDQRKSRIEYEIPKDSKTLGKLLKNMKETERLIRQDNKFFSKIRHRKLEIELKPIYPPLPIKPPEKHSMLIAAPSRIPRSGIIINK